jgi:competence protein ComGC
MMKLRLMEKRGALTRVEVLVIIAAVVLLALCLMPALARAKAKAGRICCNCNLKQIGMSFKIWAGDHQDNYPMQAVATNGGTMELVAAGLVFPHFAVLSNELCTPYVLVCPADKSRTRATNFDNLSNANVSYFLGLDAGETNPQMFLAGDSNLEIDGQPVPSGILNLWTNSAVGWTAERHIRCGNIALADGSTQQFSNAKLREALANTGMATNRLAIP